jgi:hypothetical protein
MKPLSWDKQLGLASPLECAAIQSGQDQPPKKGEGAGCKSPHPRLPWGEGENFFLDILSHRKAYGAVHHCALYNCCTAVAHAADSSPAGPDMS